MDLKSATEGASWHPLTSLITFESAAQNRDLYLVPVSGDEYQKHYSTVFHEITHLWSARTTRLGWLLSRTAAECFMRWKEGQDNLIDIPERIQRLIAAYTPILEGLAMYAQLDYEAETPGYLLPSPLTQVLSEFEVSLIGNHSLKDLFRIIRDNTRYEREGFPGLIELLLLDGDNEHKNYYLFGYFYIKALSSLLTHRCKKCANPSLFLPLVIRLLCDHPIVTRIITETVSEQEIITELHTSVISLTPRQLDSLTRMLEVDETREKFDILDIYAQIASDNYKFPCYHDQDSIELFFPDDDPVSLQEWITKFRAAASIHFTSWKHGLLHEITDDYLILSDSGKEIRVFKAVFWPWWRKIWEQEIDATNDPRKKHDLGIAADITYLLEMDFYKQLGEHLHQEITIANFISFADDGIFGVAFWANGSLKAWFPFMPLSSSYIPLPDHIELIRKGLDISPLERKVFAKSLKNSSSIWHHAGTAGVDLLAKMVSNEVHRDDLVRQRCGILGSDHVLMLRDWSKFRLYHIDKRPPAELLAAGDQIFDFPGFLQTASEGIKFQDLLPRLLPLKFKGDYS